MIRGSWVAHGATEEGECRQLVRRSAPQAAEKSRSQIKRDFRALKELGIRLAELPKGQLGAIPLSDETRAVVLEAQGMARNALQRHYRYLSSLLAKEDVAAIKLALTGERQPHVKEVAQQQAAIDALVGAGMLTRSRRPL